MIKKLGTQSIDIDLLSHNGSVIDIGCGYNFGLTKELLDIGCKVIGVDPNTRITDILKHPNFKFHQQAVVTNDSIKEIELLHYGLGTEAATVVQSQYKGFPFDPIDEICRVPTITIKAIIRRYKLDQVDLIAFNAEGAEYELLKAIDGPITKQLSVSFHDFRNLNPYYPDNERYYRELFETLTQWYDIAQHNLHKAPWVPPQYSVNYWDSLFVLKEEYII